MITFEKETCWCLQSVGNYMNLLIIRAQNGDQNNFKIYLPKKEKNYTAFPNSVSLNN